MSDLRAVVVGTGMMGPGIAATLAAGGVAACLVSRSSNGADEGLLQARSILGYMGNQGLLDPAQLPTALDCLSCSIELDAEVAAADLVVESIPEDLALKRRFFQRLASVGPKKTILARTPQASASVPLQRVVSTPKAF